jgi:hypothetical protein
VVKTAEGAAEVRSGAAWDAAGAALDGAPAEATWLAKGARGAEDTTAPTVDAGAGAGGTVVEAAGECGAEVTTGRDSAPEAATTDVAGGTVCSAFEAPRSGEGSGARCSDWTSSSSPSTVRRDPIETSRRGDLQNPNRKPTACEAKKRRFDETHKAQTNGAAESSPPAGAPVVDPCAGSGSSARARFSGGSPSEGGVASRARFPLGSEVLVPEDASSEVSTATSRSESSPCCVAPAPGGPLSPSSSPSEGSPPGAAPGRPPPTLPPLEFWSEHSNWEKGGMSDVSGETVSPLSSRRCFSRFLAFFLAFSLLYRPLLRLSSCSDRPFFFSSGSGRRHGGTSSRRSAGYRSTR